jgi:hypothetical protein
MRVCNVPAVLLLTGRHRTVVVKAATQSISLSYCRVSLKTSIFWDIFTVVTMKSVVLWDMALENLVTLKMEATPFIVTVVKVFQKTAVFDHI